MLTWERVRPIGMMPAGVLGVRHCIALRLSLAQTVCHGGITKRFRHELLSLTASQGLLLHGRALGIPLMLGCEWEPGGGRGRGPGVKGSLRGGGCSPLGLLHGKAARVGLCHGGRQSVGLSLHGLNWDCWGYQVGQGGWHAAGPLRLWEVHGLGVAIAGTVLSLHTHQKSIDCSKTTCLFRQSGVSLNL